MSALKALPTFSGLTVCISALTTLKELQERTTLPGLISFLNLKDAIAELSNC